MVKKILFIMLVFLLLLASFVFSSTPSSDYDSPGGVSVGGDSDDGDDGVEVTEETQGDTHYLYMRSGLVCNNDPRDGDSSSPVPVSTHFSWYDGDAELKENQAYYQKAFGYLNTTSIATEGLFGWSLGSCTPTTCTGDYYCKGGCEGDTKVVGGWPTNKPSQYNPYEWDSDEPYEPYLTLNLGDMGWPDENVRLIRYEGDCQGFFQMEHTKYPGDDEDTNEESKGGKYTYYIGNNQVVGQGRGEETKLLDVFTEDIYWDKDKKLCELLGGEWLDDETEGASEFAEGDRSWRCCGDDWIWLYNRPVDYDSSVNPDTPEFNGKAEEGEVCLYNDGEDVGMPTYPVEGLRADDGNYRCKKTYEAGGREHVAYDPALELDEEYRAEDGIQHNTGGLLADSEDPFFFAGADDSPYETDVGKWSDQQGENPMFCYHEFDPDSEHGEKFDWLTIEEAAEKNQLICDAYLGYNWTGEGCCMPDETYEDEGTSCDARDIVRDLDSNDLEFSSPTFEEEFMEDCESQQLHNLACFEGDAISNNTATEVEPGHKELFNSNGKFYFCNRSEGEQIYEDYEHTPKCGLQGKERFPAICTYKNDSWVQHSQAGWLGWGEDDRGATREEIEEGVGLSELPDFEDWPANLPEDIQKKECCYFDSCWNGTRCVSADEDHGIYQVEESDGEHKWKPGWEGADPDETNYVCDGGKWIESDAKFNWYHDTSDFGLCVEPHGCFCKPEETDTYDYSCGEENVNGHDCTKEPNFYKEDHICEAKYDNSGNIEGSRWTSRTKLIALQLRELADDDYVLFCDDKGLSVNSPEKLDDNSLPYEINNVCVIEYDDKTAMGFSFNADSDNPMDEFIFGNHDINGFANVVDFETGAESCESGESEEPNGAYRKCVADNDKLWVNNKTNSVIYSKEGLDVSGESLDVPEQEDFDDFINLIGDVIEDTNEKPDAADVITTASNFNRLYALNKGEEEIFGVVEKRRNPHINSNEDNNGLREYLALEYEGLGDVCEKTDFAKEKDPNKHGNLYCHEAGDNYVLLQMAPAEETWSDLAPKIRVI